MVKVRRLLSAILVLMTLITMSSSFRLNASAAQYTGRVTCIKYNATGKNAGKSTYVTRYYTFDKNEKITIQGYWNTEKLNKQTSVGIDNKKLKDYLRFDVHIIDKKTEQVVNYWYSLKSGDTFKVFSAVPSINSKQYTVKITSYLWNYKTYVNSNLAGVATYLKYSLKY